MRPLFCERAQGHVRASFLGNTSEFRPCGRSPEKGKTNCSYLQNVVVLDTLSDGNLFKSLEDLREVLVRDVVQLGAMV